MTFEVYDFSNIVESITPSIKISKSAIVLNKQLRQKLEGNRVEIAFDKKLKTMRIRSVGPEEMGIEIQKTKIPAKKLLEHFGIKQEGRFEARFDEKEKSFFIRIG